MNYQTRLKDISQFVKVKIPKNKKNFSRAEKATISRYYNRLNAMGYFAEAKTGSVLKDISRTKYKVKGMPKLKKLYINVGTRIIDGKIETDTRSSVKIQDGKIYILRGKRLKKWEFTYNVILEGSKQKFRKHVKKRMGQDKLKKGQFVVAGAGMYEMNFSATDDLNQLSDMLDKMRHQYAQEHAEGIRKAHPSDFMGRIIVYESRDEIRRNFVHKQRMKSLRKRKTKRSRIKGR